MKNNITLIIDNKKIEVSEGLTVLNAGRKAGISIPSMCYKSGYTNHPSCMICIVKDKKSGKLFPSCAVPVSENMEIITSDSEINEMRKENLELLLSDHVGDCEAPCRTACPSFMDIPLMNRLIAERNFKKAVEIVKQEIALPLTLGYICSAPCEKVCRRRQIDAPVSICMLKKFVANEDINAEKYYLPVKNNPKNKKVAIIGTGPAGLSSAYHLQIFGFDCVLFDKNEEAGGTLKYEISDKILPKKVIDNEIEIIKKLGAEFRLNTNIDKSFFEKKIKNKFDAIIIAAGNFEKSGFINFNFKYNKSGIAIKKGTCETEISGIFACGSVVRSQKMSVKSLAQGKTAAHSVNLFLETKNIEKKKRMFNSKFGKLFNSEIIEYQKEASKNKRIEPAENKTKIFLQNEAVKEAIRCMRCDCRKSNNCKLRTYADEYKSEQRKFAFGKRKIIKKYFRHETIVYEPEKCIRCRLCVDITEKNEELIGFASVGRGFDFEINIPFNQSIKNAITKTAKECVKSCPTGALAYK